MGCACKHKGRVIVQNNKEESIVNGAIVQPTKTDRPVTKMVLNPVAVAEALDIDESQCYLCAKKHIGRAQINFEEYHTGYPDHIKNLMESLKVAEDDVRKAFLQWQRVQAHLDMSAGELLGNDLNKETMKEDHVEVATKIREERLKLQNDPLYSPDFDSLLVAIQLLEQKSLN